MIIVKFLNSIVVFELDGASIGSWSLKIMC